MTEAAPSLLATWLLGASMGLTACTATCLPFMGTWMVARGSGPGQGSLWKDTAGFIAGRISAYILLGTLAALAGQELARFLDQGLGHLLIGGATLAAALWLLADSGQHKPCAVARKAQAPGEHVLHFQPQAKSAWQDSSPPFAVGFSLSLIPCAPLASLLAICTQAGQAGSGALQGLSFGLGAALTPLLILLPLLGRMGSHLGTSWRGNGLRYLGVLILAALGVRQLYQGLVAGGVL